MINIGLVRSVFFMTTASTEMEDSSKATSGLSQPLFAQVQFHIVPSPEFQGEPADSVRRVRMTCFQLSPDVVGF